MTEIQTQYETVEEAARLSGLSGWTIRDLIRNQKIQGKKYGKRLLVDAESRRRYLESLPDASFAPLPKRREAV